MKICQITRCVESTIYQIYILLNDIFYWIHDSSNEIFYLIHYLSNQKNNIFTKFNESQIQA